MSKETEARALLQRVHDLLDNRNAEGIDSEPACLWCKADSYGSDGIEHLDGCILMELRVFLAPAIPRYQD